MDHLYGLQITIIHCAVRTHNIAVFINGSGAGNVDTISYADGAAIANFRFPWSTA